MTIKYSIIIPTRNRAEYLPYAIKSVINSPRLDIELIVSNNHSTDETREILTKIIDHRVKIIAPEISLSMAGHYEFAISHAKGEWITILGDDDAVMPHIFDSLDKYICQYPNIDIISSARAYYFWKGCEDLYGKSVVIYRSSPNIKIRSTKKDLIGTLKGLRSCFDMPQIYTTGIVKRSLYNEIKKKSGGFFYHSIIPDMYSVVALCLSREEYLRVEEPLFWVGTSNKSLGRSDRIYKDAEKLKISASYKNLNIPKKISNYASYLLHSHQFGPYYIFECFLQCPLKKTIFNLKKIRTDVLAAVLNMLFKKNIEEKKILKKEIYLECNHNNISIKNLYISAYRNKIINLFLFFYKLPSFILSEFGLGNYCVLKSKHRNSFTSILNASEKLKILKDKK